MFDYCLTNVFKVVLLKFPKSKGGFKKKKKYLDDEKANSTPWAWIFFDIFNLKMILKYKELRLA